MLKLAIIIEVAPHLAAQAMAAAQQALAPFGAPAQSAAAPSMPQAQMPPGAPPAMGAYPSNPPTQQPPGGFAPPPGAPSMPPAPPPAQPAPQVPGQVTAQDLYTPMQKYAQQHRADGVAKVFDAIGVPSRSLANCTPEQLALAKQWFDSMQLPA